jgi:hypothetical protein
LVGLVVALVIMKEITTFRWCLRHAASCTCKKITNELACDSLRDSVWRQGSRIGVDISAPHDHRQPQALHAAQHERDAMHSNAQVVKATGEQPTNDVALLTACIEQTCAM